jgi:hypothetical protein
MHCRQVCTPRRSRTVCTRLVGRPCPCRTMIHLACYRSPCIRVRRSNIRSYRFGTACSQLRTSRRPRRPDIRHRDRHPCRTRCRSPASAACRGKLEAARRYTPIRPGDRCWRAHTSFLGHRPLSYRAQRLAAPWARRSARPTRCRGMHRARPHHARFHRAPPHRCPNRAGFHWVGKSRYQRKMYRGRIPW